jgi:predicted permease
VGFSVTVGQVVLMFCFIGLGVVAAKLGWITQAANAGLTKVVLWFVLPPLILTSFSRPFSWAELRQVGLAFAAGLVSYAVTIGLAALLFRGWVTDPVTRTALRFGTVYSNVGFLGIPLVQAIIGADGVFYCVTYLAAFNLVCWTHGFGLFGRREPRSWRARLGPLVKNPNLIALGLGLVVFVTSARLPRLLSDGLGYLAALNAPLSMMIIGVSLSVLHVRDFARDGWAWAGTAVRNLVFPLLCLGLLTLTPVSDTARLAVFITMACPVAAFLVMFSVIHQADTAFATRLFCVSTLSSIVTLPALVALAQAVW